MNEVFTSLRRTPYQTFAALSVLFFTLLLSGLLFISLTFLQGLLEYVETRPRLIIYFQVQSSEDQIFAVKNKIESTGKSAKVSYITQNQAYEIYKEFTKNDPLLAEMTSPDILPPSLEVDVKEPKFLADIAELVASEQGVDEVQFQKDIVDNLLALTGNVRRITIIFFSYLMFMSIIVLTTTLSFKIALKKEEIGILKLLGATNMYIRKPFVKESVFLGILSTALANIFLIGLLITFNSTLITYFQGMGDLSIRVLGLPLQVFPFNLTFAMLTLSVTIFFSLSITLISSFMATNRYLK
jgi:cell division transport system permease protein